MCDCTDHDDTSIDISPDGALKGPCPVCARDLETLGSHWPCPRLPAASPEPTDGVVADPEAGRYSERVTVRVPESLLRAVDELVSYGAYQSRSQAIRAAAFEAFVTRVQGHPQPVATDGGEPRPDGKADTLESAWPDDGVETSPRVVVQTAWYGADGETIERLQYRATQPNGVVRGGAGYSRRIIGFAELPPNTTVAAESGFELFRSELEDRAVYVHWKANAPLADSSDRDRDSAQPDGDAADLCDGGVIAADGGATERSAIDADLHAALVDSACHPDFRRYAERAAERGGTPILGTIRHLHDVSSVSRIAEIGTPIETTLWDSGAQATLARHGNVDTANTEILDAICANTGGRDE